MTRYFADNSPMLVGAELLKSRVAPLAHIPQTGLFAGSTRVASTRAGGLFSDISPEDALEIIENSFDDEESMEAYTNKSHPDHERVVLLMTAMHRIGHPEPAKEAAPPATGDAMASQIMEQAIGEKAVLSPLQARAEIANLYSDKGFLEAYQKNDHMGHAGAVQRMADLHSAAYPEAPEGR